MTYKVLIIKYKFEPLYHGDDAMIRDNSNDNIGFTRGVNFLLREMDRLGLSSEDVILLSDDARPLGDCFAQLERTAYSSADIGIVQAKLRLPDGRIDTTGHQWKTKMGLPVLVAGRGSGEIDNGQYDQQKDMPSADLACAFVKRIVLDKVGRMDERFLHGFDDVDFSIRTRGAGFRILFEPKAVAIHLRGVFTPNRGRGFINFGIRCNVERLKLYAKHHWWKLLLWAYLWNLAGIFVGAFKLHDVKYTMMKLRAVVPF